MAFVESDLRDEFPDGIDVVAVYRLDSDDFYVVEVASDTGSTASFTVELLGPTATPPARIVRQPR